MVYEDLATRVNAQLKTLNGLLTAGPGAHSTSWCTTRTCRRCRSRSSGVLPRSVVQVRYVLPSTSNLPFSSAPFESVGQPVFRPGDPRNRRRPMFFAGERYDIADRVAFGVEVNRVKARPRCTQPSGPRASAPGVLFTFRRTSTWPFNSGSNENCHRFRLPFPDHELKWLPAVAGLRRPPDAADSSSKAALSISHHANPTPPRTSLYSGNKRSRNLRLPN